MKTKEKINEEAEEIYFAIKEVMEKSGLDYCQSWWLNTRNFDLKSKLSTQEINQRAKLLIKRGFLIINKSQTSKSTGICYKLTDKPFQTER